MSKEKKNVLILDGISSQGLPIMRSFFKSGHNITIVCPHRLCAGFFSRYAHKKLIWPELYTNEDEILTILIVFLKNNDIDLVLGLGDKTAHLISKNKEQIEQYSKTIVPNISAFSKAIDKYKTMKFCMENKIPCPFTLDGDNIDIRNVEKEIRFPVIIKPKVGVGSIGVFKYKDAETLIKDFKGLTKKFGSMIIQDFIPNEEQYTVEAFCDKNSKVKFCIVVAKKRFYPISGGTSSCNVTVDKPEIRLVVTKFLEKLKWIGNANLDIIYDVKNNTPKIIEINPRVGAMVRIAFKSGVNVADMQCQLAFDSEVLESKEYSKSIVLRNLFLDIPWLLSNNFKIIKNSKPWFFNFFGKKVYYQNFSMDDPFVFLGYFFSKLNITKLREKFIRKRGSN